MTTPLGSIVIAAHNEESVIGRTLAHFTGVLADGLVDVVVVCNGCSDRTAEVARGFRGVRALELERPSKTAALREGDRVAVAGPRIYLDADVELTGRAAVATLRALADGALAGRPRHTFDAGKAPWAVRRWYAVREQLPSVSRALWGAGCYGLSEQGRARFGEFPEILGDDVFIDSLFTADEVTIIPTDPVIVRTPRTVTDLVRTKTRSYRSQEHVVEEVGRPRLSRAQRRQAGDLWSLLRRRPTNVVDVGVYLAVLTVSRLRARVDSSSRWERDTSSRRTD
ncbi:glycosyltransferase [Ornithinimicrobium ciconiae]|uniref:Glycosyltransferase n=1 Tax=Ornithinimicrobium ciconiae TaxID=2594265 RepID=A0A516G7H8_9MICO|nr:glycosyltransferase [Ornithinimicrobium ciconiae]QDO87442.1 glycosyltransferase [Ornithinimicrobium ciconiae]